MTLRGAPLRVFGQAAYSRVIMQKYKQLDLKGRHKIKALLEAGHSQTKIAEIIRVHKSTISRELTRNVPTCSGYANEYSPELISGRWNVMGVDGVSHEAIYQWIWRGKRQKDPATKTLYKHLKHGRRRRKRGNTNDSRGILTGRVSIEERPQVADERSRLGDLEIDLMVGKAHKSALVVIIDRATLLTRLKKITSRHADSTELAIEESLARIPKTFIKTVTVDNDKAFANHQSLARTLDADVYFTRPYTSQDKGTVDNSIGVVREFFPKGTDLRNVSDQYIQTVERHLNNRPVRKFDYLSPIQQTLKYRAVALMT